MYELLKKYIFTEKKNQSQSHDYRLTFIWKNIFYCIRPLVICYVVGLLWVYYGELGNLYLFATEKVPIYFHFIM